MAQKIAALLAWVRRWWASVWHIPLPFDPPPTIPAMETISVVGMPSAPPERIIPEVVKELLWKGKLWRWHADHPDGTSTWEYDVVVNGQLVANTIRVNTSDLIQRSDNVWVFAEE